MKAQHLAALLPFLGGPAFGQTFDYTAAEQMLGEPVTMSVTGKPQRVSDAPANIVIVTADQIRRSGAVSIPEVLRFVAGIDVRRYGQLNFSVGIRGYNTALNNRVLVLLDGRQVYQDDYGLTNWSLIPVALTAIRQIEIVKGPNAALYGFNAVSGVINIVTYDPLHDAVNAASAVGGTQRLAYGEAVATAQPSDDLGVRLSANGIRAAEFRGHGPGLEEQPYAGNAALDIRRRLAPGVEWTLSGSYGAAASAIYLDTGSFLNSTAENASIRSNLSADTTWGLFNLDVYHNNNLSGFYTPITNETTKYAQNLTVLKASDIFKLDTDHTFRFAAEYRNSAATSQNLFNGKLGYQIVAGSAMWEWRVLDDLVLTNAVRLDVLTLNHKGRQFEVPGFGPIYRDATLVEPSFNSGAVYTLGELDSIRLTAARALQLPSLVDFGYGIAYANPPLLIAGNSGLKPSATTSFEVSYEHKLPELASVARFAVFHQSLDRTIGSPFGSGFTPLPTGQIGLLARNFDGSRQVGGEIGLQGAAAGFRWNLGYALAATRDETPAAQLLFAPSAAYARQSPLQAVVVGGGYTWDRFEIDAQVRWQSRFQDYRLDTATFLTLPVSIPDYVTANLHVGYRVSDGMTLSMTVEQLNRPFLVQTSGLRIERRIFGGIKAQF